MASPLNPVPTFYLYGEPHRFAVRNFVHIELLDDRALLEARRTLIYSELSIADVGFLIGIPDPAYFSRFFKRNTGQSPRDFREMHLKKKY